MTTNNDDDVDYVYGAVMMHNIAIHCETPSGSWYTMIVLIIIITIETPYVVRVEYNNIDLQFKNVPTIMGQMGHLPPAAVSKGKWILKSSSNRWEIPQLLEVVFLVVVNETCVVGLDRNVADC